MAAFGRAELLAAVPDEVRDSAVNLDTDINEDAFPVASAGKVLDALASADVVVLGGDFYEREASGRFRPLGMNWYFEGRDGATSVARARAAISQRWVAADWFVTFVWRG